MTGWDNKYVDELGGNDMKYGTISVLHGQRGPFTYRVPDDPDICELQHSNLEPGDFVIVKNRFGYSAGEVFEVHDEPQDERDDITYAWAFQAVDEDAWNYVMASWNDA